jgi:plasmid stabilization system protein ParE
MRIVWTEEALDDLAEIVAHYEAEASATTAEMIAGRIVSQVEALPPFPERIRSSDRIRGARELVISGLPFVAFIKLESDAIVVLNIVHTARRFPT